MDLQDIRAQLSRPFAPAEVRWKPGAVSGVRALALPYITARAVMDRLDAVVGLGGWEDSYQVLAEGCVLCTLRLRLGSEWITKMDVGGQSEQPDEGDKAKAAFSDALKRAAVKFGIGRYLYRLPQLWCDYDRHKRQFVRPPALPPWALPRPAKPAAAKAAEPLATNEQLQRAGVAIAQLGLTRQQVLSALPTGIERLSALPRQAMEKLLTRWEDLAAHVDPHQQGERQAIEQEG